MLGLCINDKIMSLYLIFPLALLSDSPRRFNGQYKEMGDRGDGSKKTS